MSEEFERRSSGLSLLHRVSRVVNSNRSPDEMLGEIVGLAAEAYGCDACLVYLVESATGEFALRASQVPRSHDFEIVRVKPGEGITGWVAEHQSSVALSSRASADPRFKAFSGLVEDTYEAFLSVPLVSKGQTIGVINVHHLEQHQHTPDEIAAVTSIGEQMGGAIAKSLLEEETPAWRSATASSKNSAGNWKEKSHAEPPSSRQPTRSCAWPRKRRKRCPPQERVSGQDEP